MLAAIKRWGLTEVVIALKHTTKIPTIQLCLENLKKTVAILFLFARLFPGVVVNPGTS